MSEFQWGDRVTVTYGIWAENRLVGTVERPADSGFDWWIRFDGRDEPAQFYERELERAKEPLSAWRYYDVPVDD